MTGLALTLMLLSADAPAADTLTDQSIAAYAARPYDKAAKMNTHEVMGVHHGVRVVVDYPCSDVCPVYTSRIIHYEAAPGPDCDRIGGQALTLMVPYGIGVRREAFCVPQVLATPRT